MLNNPRIRNADGTPARGKLLKVLTVNDELRKRPRKAAGQLGIQRYSQIFKTGNGMECGEPSGIFCSDNLEDQSPNSICTYIHAQDVFEVRVVAVPESMKTTTDPRPKAGNKNLKGIGNLKRLGKSETVISAKKRRINGPHIVNDHCGLAGETR